MSKPTPLSTAIDGLTTELEAQRRDRARTPESDAALEAQRHPLRHIAPRGALSLLVRVPGWWRFFKQIDSPPLDGAVLRCPCGAAPTLRDSALVGCECDRAFVLHDGGVFVTYLREYDAAAPGGGLAPLAAGGSPGAPRSGA